VYLQKWLATIHDERPWPFEGYTLVFKKKNLNPNLGAENSLYFYISQREKPGSQGK